MTTEKHEQKFKQIMKEKNLSHCECGQELSIGDMAWNNGCTEYGTGFTYVYVTCPKCNVEVARASEWGECDDLDGALDVLDNGEGL